MLAQSSLCTQCPVEATTNTLMAMYNLWGCAVTMTGTLAEYAFSLLGSAGMVILPIHFAMAQAVDPANAWKLVPKGVSTQQLSVRASMLKSILLSEGWTNTTFDKAYNGPDEVIPTLDGIMRTYAYRTKRDQAAYDFYQKAGVILEGAFLAMSPFGPSGSAASLVTTFGIKGGDRSSASATKELMTFGSDQTSKWLRPVWPRRWRRTLSCLITWEP